MDRCQRYEFFYFSRKIKCENQLLKRKVEKLKEKKSLQFSEKESQKEISI